MALFARLLLLSLMLVLSGCPDGTRQDKPDNVLSDYGAAIRWNEFDKALAFLDPEQQEQLALTDLERERFKQIQVTGYEVKNRENDADGNIIQTVEIRLVNRNTQIERSIIDHQTWRRDIAGKRYWLTSGLPDFNLH
jgi:hypothetical protein